MAYLHDFFSKISNLTPATSYTLADHVAAAANVVSAGGGGGPAVVTYPLAKSFATDPLSGADAGMYGDVNVNYATSGSSSSVFVVKFNPAGTVYKTFWLNENGSPRAAMGKPSDSALKLIGYGTGQTGNTVEFQHYSGAGTGGRITDFAIGPDNKWKIGASEVTGYLCVTIGAGDTAPPVGTPPGTPVIKPRA